MREAGLLCLFGGALCWLLRLSLLGLLLQSLGASLYLLATDGADEEGADDA